MPLPAIAEQAADKVAAELRKLDRQIADHLTKGTRLPTVAQVMAPIEQAISRAMVAALRDIGGTVTSRTVTGFVDDVAGPIREQVVEALRRAKRARRVFPRKPPTVEPDTDGTIADLIRKAGIGGALILLLSRRPARERTPAKVREIARQVGIKPPRPLSAYGKMVVRTRVAMARNTHAADMVDAANAGTPQAGPYAKWAALIRDGLNGPTDRDCERVDGKWATALWLRRHTVEHPNCTREGRPGPLPPGEHITLLR